MAEKNGAAPDQDGATASEISQLGFLEKTYGSGFGGYLGCVVLLLAFFAIPLYAAGAFRSPGGWVGFSIVLVCLVGGVVVAFLRRNWQASVYTKGLVVTKGKQVQIARWEDIVAVDRLVRSFYNNAGGYGTRAKQTSYQIRLSTGPAIMITTDFSGRTELIDTIEQKIQLMKLNQPDS